MQKSTERVECLSDLDCEQIVKEAINNLTPATVFLNGESRVDHKYRICDRWHVCGDGPSVNLSKSLGVQEAQIVRYKSGGHYSWHQDGRNRISTVLVLLSDPSDFQGGILEIRKMGRLELRRGCPFWFSSGIPHRVHPITSGERWVFVGWKLKEDNNE